MENKIDDALIEKYIKNFLGYGNIYGDYWFIGKEEGGDDDLAKNLNRIHVWLKRGENGFEDLYDYHLSINRLEWFEEKPKLQRTWKGLISILYSSQGKEEFTIDDIRVFQSKKLGRFQSETCLSELLPLPSRSTRLWDYSEVSNLPYLESRKKYREEIGELRAKKLKYVIQEVKPKLVVFYSTDTWYMDKWRIISDMDFQEQDGVLFAKNFNTVFGIVPHPTAMGISNQYLHNAGTLFYKLINNRY